MRWTCDILQDDSLLELWSPDGEAWFEDRGCTSAFNGSPSPRSRPVWLPPAIFGIGQNYRKHAEEMGGKLPTHPTVFMKNPSSIASHGEPIRLPQVLHSAKVDYEAELAIIIGTTCRNVQEAEALSVIKGFACANDVSARDWQKEWGGGQFCKGKGFDTFCPIGPVGVSVEAIANPQDLRLQTRVNGQTVQDCSTADMIFSIAQLIAFLSADTTLLANTVILTGTPHGVGTARIPPLYLQSGDVVEVEIESIGVLRNPVV